MVILSHFVAQEWVQTVIVSVANRRQIVVKLYVAVLW